MHRLSSSLLGPVFPSFRALSGRIKSTARLYKSNKDYLPLRSGDNLGTFPERAGGRDNLDLT